MALDPRIRWHGVAKPAGGIPASDLDTSTVLRKYAADCVATTNPQTFTHALGYDVTVQVWEGATLVTKAVTRSSSSGGQVTVNFAGAPTLAQYRVVIHG